MAPYRSSTVSSCPSVLCARDSRSDALSGTPSSRSSIATASALPNQSSSCVLGGASSLPGTLPTLLELSPGYNGRASELFGLPGSSSSSTARGTVGELGAASAGSWRRAPTDLRGGVGGHSICDLDDFAALEDASECGQRFTVPEASFLRKFWNVFIISLLSYTGTVFPFRLCFMEFKIPEPIPPGAFWESIDVLVDVAFWADLFLNFLFTYVDDIGREVFSLPKIAKRYLRGNFLVNLIGCFPAQLVSWLVYLGSDDDGAGKLNKAGQLVRLQKASRLAQFLRLVRILRAFPYLAQSLVFKRIRSFRGTRIINFILFLLWVVHLVACGWYLVASLHADHQETWVSRRVLHSDGATLYEAGPVEQWCNAMYFVLAVFTTVGFGDIHAVTSAEVVYAFVTMMIGIVINSIIVGKMVTAVTRVDQHDIDLTRQKDIIEGFAEHAQLGSAKSEELFASLSTSRAVRRGFDREQVRTLLNSSHLPRKVMGQLPRDIFGGRLLQNRIIRDLHSRLEMPARLPLLVAVAVHQRFVWCKEVVYYCYDHPESLFLVLEGAFANVARPDCAGGLSELPPSVERLFRISEQYGTGATTNKQAALYPYQLFCHGSYFGEGELLLEQCPRRSCVRCESESGGLLLALHKDDLASIVREFPRFGTAWRDAALRREAHRRVMLARLTAGQSFRNLAAGSIQRYFRSTMASRAREGSSLRHLSLRLHGASRVGSHPERAANRVSDNQPVTQADLNKLRVEVGELRQLLQQVFHEVSTPRWRASDEDCERPPADSVRTPPVEQPAVASAQLHTRLVGDWLGSRQPLAPLRGPLPAASGMSHELVHSDLH